MLWNYFDDDYKYQEIWYKTSERLWKQVNSLKKKQFGFFYLENVCENASTNTIFHIDIERLSSKIHYTIVWR